MDHALVQILTRMDARGEMAQEANKVEVCDGEDAAAVKAYLRALSQVPVDLQQDVLLQTARGSLLRESRAWLGNHAYNFEEYKLFVLATFVSQDAEHIARRELHRISRQPGESVLSYNRRFREAAVEAYPGAHNPEQVESMVRLYAAGLRDPALASLIIKPAWPVAVEEALTRVANDEVKKNNLSRLGIRSEEPMEVDAMRTSHAASREASNTEKELHLLKTQYGKLEAKLDRLLEARAQPPAPRPRPAEHHGSRVPARPRPQPQQRQQPEARACFLCGEVGHLRRQCPQQSRRQNRPKPVAATSGRQ